MADGHPTSCAASRQMAGSTVLAHQPLLIPLPVALLDGLALVVDLLAPRQRQLDLRPAGRVEVDRQRDQSQALAGDRTVQLGDLTALEQQLALPPRLVVEPVTVAV